VALFLWVDGLAGSLSWCFTRVSEVLYVVELFPCIGFSLTLALSPERGDLVSAAGCLHGNDGGDIQFGIACSYTVSSTTRVVRQIATR
jgi:hypothetical protein